MNDFGDYAKTLYTIAQIADVGDQLLRQSRKLLFKAMPRARALLRKDQRWRLPR